MKAWMILSALILITGCNKPLPQSYYPVLEPYECNTTIHTNSAGGLNRREAGKLMKCYREMKLYYKQRDSAFNAIYGGKNG